LSDNTIETAHRVAKTMTKWFSVLIGMVCILCWVLLLVGSMEIDLELDGGFKLNGVFVIGFIGFLFSLAFYIVSFIATLGVLFVMSKTQRVNQAGE